VWDCFANPDRAGEIDMSFHFARLFFAVVVIVSLAGCARGVYQPADVVIPDAHGGGSALAVSADSSLLASGGWAGDIRLWDLPAGAARYRWQAHRGEVSGLFFLQHGAILSSGYDGRLVRWSLRGQELGSAVSDSPITVMAVDVGAALIVTGHDDGSIRTWSLPELAPLTRVGTHDGATRAVAIAPGGALLASSATDGQVKLWFGEGEGKVLPKAGSDARTLVFSPDGRFLYGAGWFDLFRWELATAALTTIDTDHQGIVNSVMFSPDGSYLASISRQTDSSVLFLDPDTGQTLKRFQPHTLCGGVVVITPDGQTLATTADDASIMIWALERDSGNSWLRSMGKAE
jgi:WD40 repeat protein